MRALMLCVALFAVACPAELPPLVPLPPPGPDPFLEISSELGLQLPPVVVGDPVGSDCEIVRFMGPGIAVADFDGDGALDLFIPRVAAPDRYYQQRRGRFVEATELAGLSNTNDAHGALAFDADGDADLDIYVTSPSGRARFYINDGEGRFAEEAETRGVAVVAAGELAEGECSRMFSATAFDLEDDGDLDLLVAAWDGSDRSRVFANDGTGGFSDVTTELGFELAERAVLTAFPHDVDDDGQEEIVWINDFDDSFVSRRTNGRWQDFEVEAIQNLRNGMGVDAADINGDGSIELFAGGICVGSPCRDFPGWTGNLLMQGGQDIALDAGVRNAGWAWGAAFADLDGDGDEDLVVTNGYGFLSNFEQDELRLFENDGTGLFEQAGPRWGVVDSGQTRAVVPADFDRDGDLDLFITRQDQSVLVWRNDHQTAGTVIELHGRAPNTQGIGARATVTLRNGVTKTARLRAAAYLSSRPPGIHLAVAPEEIASVVVEWPDGQSVTYDSPCLALQCILQH